MHTDPSPAWATSWTTYDKLFFPDDEPEYLDRDFTLPLEREGRRDLVSAADVEAIRTCIRNCHLPSYQVRLPSNLGEASHGSLRAFDWLILCTVIFPLIIPELWFVLDDDPAQDVDKEAADLLLRNFYALVATTNIASAYTTSIGEAEAYRDLYRVYIETLQQLTPETFTQKEVHHLGTHIYDSLMFFGPLGSLSESAGERLQGEFKKEETSGRAGMVQSPAHSHSTAEV
jgi:hypothetical protein